MIKTGDPQHLLLIRRPWPRPGTPTAHSGSTTESDTTPTRDTKTDSLDKTSFVYCYVPQDSEIRPTLSNLVLMASRRWPVEETIT